MKIIPCNYQNTNFQIKHVLYCLKNYFHILTQKSTSIQMCFEYEFAIFLFQQNISKSLFANNFCFSVFCNISSILNLPLFFNF